VRQRTVWARGAEPVSRDITMASSVARHRHGYAPGMTEDEARPEEPREDDRNDELDDSPVPDAGGEHTEDEDTAPT
jgi:hypothetical protein